MANADYTNEIWKDIPGWEGLYQASSLGRVRSLDRVSRITTPTGIESSIVRRGRVLKARNARDGYEYVELMKSGKLTRRSIAVHRLVCSAFHGESKLHAAHRDGTRTNNRPDNLRWATREQNEADKIIHGRPRGRQKLTEDQVREIRHSSEPTAVLRAKFGVSQVLIDGLRRGLGWRHIK